MDIDCCFNQYNNWFRYRAAAIIIEDDCVLFATNKNEDYFYSIGGGVHIGETSKQALLREVYEETGIHYSIDRLAVIHENFFKGTGMVEGMNCHEIAFYYLMKPKGNKSLNSTSINSYGVTEETRWIPIKDLHKYKAFPTFLADYLSKRHTGVEHIITDENITKL